MTSAVGRVMRASSAPVRNYFNEHFAMVKDEVRQSTVQIDDTGAWQRMAELENTLAEMSLYQARVLNRLSDDVDQLVERIGDLERVVAQLAAVATAQAEQR
jgi:hypothetical protein